MVVVSAVGRGRLSLIVSLGKRLRVEIDVSLGSHGGGSRCRSGRLFRMRRAASLAIAAAIRNGGSWTECHGIRLLDQVTQAVEIGRRKQLISRRPSRG